MSWPKVCSYGLRVTLGAHPHSLQRGDPPGPPSSLGSLGAGCILGAICPDLLSQL